MTDAEAKKARAQDREFPETLEILGRIRTALATRMFQTNVGDSTEREAIFLRVQTIDAMTQEIEEILRTNKAGKELDEYAAKFATTEK